MPAARRSLPPALPPSLAPSLPRPGALRAIGALMLREMSTRFGRTPGGYAWIVIQPLAVIVVLAAGFALILPAPGLGTSFLLFKATGYVVLIQFRAITQLVGMSLAFSRPLLDYPAVVWIDAVLARFLLNALVTTLVAYLLLAGILVYEGLNPVLDWPPILSALALSVALAFGVGCLNAYLFLRFEVWQQAWGILTAPLFIISGVIFLFEDLPPAAQDVLWWNPVYHITGLLREGFYSTYQPAYVSTAYVAACALVPMALGLLLLRRYARTLMDR